MITSIKNPKIKWVRDLLRGKRQRDDAGLMVIEGVRLVEEAQRALAAFPLCLYSSHLSDRGKDLLSRIENTADEVEEVAPDLLDRISDTGTSQGILLVAPVPTLKIPADSRLLLILDRLQDPGNAGTILRSANALGVDAVITTPGTVDVFAPKTLRAAMGAQFSLPVQQMAAAEIRELCTSGLTHPVEVVLSRADCALSCWEADLRAPLALVIGSEAHGASSEIMALAKRCVRIPMRAGVESFNAAVSAAILLYEIHRQRSTK